MEKVQELKEQMEELKEALAKSEDQAEITSLEAAMEEVQIDIDAEEAKILKAKEDAEAAKPSGKPFKLKLKRRHPKKSMRLGRHTIKNVADVYHLNKEEIKELKSEGCQFWIEKVK